MTDGRNTALQKFVSLASLYSKSLLKFRDQQFRMEYCLCRISGRFIIITSNMEGQFSIDLVLKALIVV